MRNRRAWWLAVLVVSVVAAAAVLAGLALVPSCAPASLQAAETTAVDWGHARQAELTGAGLAQQDHFGNSVALSASGSTALVGASSQSVSGVFQGGASYVFTLRDGIWSQAARLTVSHPAATDDFGSSVALSADGTALVGAFGRNPGGAAYVFTPRHGTWTQTGELTSAQEAVGGQFGNSVALSAAGGTALVGAPGGDPAPGSDTPPGAAYVFTLGHGGWSQAFGVAGPQTGTRDAFGFPVALSAAGGTALIGSPFYIGFTGTAYVFTGSGA
jgi:hypothetical protein